MRQWLNVITWNKENEEAESTSDMDEVVSDLDDKN